MKDMDLEQLKGKKIKVLGNLVAFTWIKPNLTSGIIIPDTVHDLAPLSGESEGVRVGRFYLGKVLAIGKKVTELKKGDLIMIHEYGIKNYEGTWLENKVYFIEEEWVKCTFSSIPEGGYLDFRTKITQDEIREKSKEVEGGKRGMDPKVKKLSPAQSLTGA